MLKVTVAMSRKNRQASTARRLHRSLGAGVSIFIVFMVLTGLAINHSTDLGLNQRHVSQPLLLDWYGLAGPDSIQSFAVGDAWLSIAGSQVYLNGGLIATMSEGVGSVFIDDMMIVAGSNELLLLDRHGQLVERQAWDRTNTGPIEALGLLPDGNVVVSTLTVFGLLIHKYWSGNWLKTVPATQYGQFPSQHPRPLSNPLLNNTSVTV
jgi:hypothetical protein